MDSAYYYHALAVALHGDHQALLKAHKKWGDWEAAWGTLGQSELFTGPEAREVSDAAREWEALLRSGTRLILCEDAEYPALLREMADPPFGIYIRGALPREILTLAIVGTRRAMPEGLRTAEEFGRVLGGAGLVIVSGLALGIDAAGHVGALGAGGVAVAVLEQNRDVFVVPGAITHANFKGSHALIRQGAELVTSPQDVLDAYGITRDATNAKREEGASPPEKLILEALRKISAPADVDKIIGMTRLEPRIVASALSFLILKDLIKETKSGYTMKP